MEQNKLIKITTNEEGKQLVSARELHEFLEVTERFSQWITKRISKYDFVEGEDFTSVKTFTLVNNGAERELEDYAITIDMAKELSMIQNTNKGKEARKYFIECEKQLKQITQSISREQELVLSIYNGGIEAVEATKELIALKEEEAKRPLLDKIEQDRPLVEFSNAIASSSDSLDMGKFAKLIKEEGVFNGGRNKLFAWLRNNGYLMKDNTPYQRFIEQGLFEIVEYTYTTPYGEKLGTKTLCTGKGQIYFVEKLRTLKKIILLTNKIKYEGN
jgi:anti-repressor protein